MFARFSLATFRRVTTQSNYLAEVDGLRFVAIAWVFLFHIYLSVTAHGSFSPPDSLSKAFLCGGAFGVELFFFISGFILGLPFAEKYRQNPKTSPAFLNPSQLLRFYARRLLRLSPPFFLSLVILAVGEAAMHKHSFAEMLPHFIAQIFYVHNLCYPNDAPMISPVAWSLEIEMQFYLIAPLLASLLYRFSPRTQLILFPALVVSIPFCLLPYCILPFKALPAYLPYFIGGMGVATYRTNPSFILLTRRISLHSSAWELVLGVILLLTIAFIPTTSNFILSGLRPSLVFLFFLVILSAPSWKYALSKAWITTLGGMSYSIYLLHLATIAATEKIALHWAIGNAFLPNFLLQTLCCLPLTLIVSVIFYKFVEQPSMRMRI